MDSSPETAQIDATGPEPAATGVVVQAHRPDPARSTPLTLAVKRAIEAVRDETRALRADPTTDLKTYEYGKSQALLDLMRARALVPPAAYSDELKAELADFKQVLEENIGLLELHMNAVSEVVQLMSRTMIDFDSDGTYQAPFPERAR
ncbi:hypothetical protein [Roseibium sp.]|uniref:hypothetical protein n=1 Tax=Roseibium sp. TaxID=1936156 RepID=UPI003BB0C255